MNVLVVGNGGREHAIARTLVQSDVVRRVFCVPGNGGTATLDRCQNMALRLDDFAGMARVAQTHGAALTIVGPEAPLAGGITDFFQEKGLKVFGPSKLGAQLEASKAWAKELMAAAGIPTARSAVFTEAEPAYAYVEEQGAPIVIKADGLASGKGVTVAETIDEAIAAITENFDGRFGAAGQRLVIEEYLPGRELSVLALTDGKTIRPLLPAQDHKRIGEGDQGPNTGGMGAYAPAPLATPELMAKIQEQILEPVIQALADREIHYCGVVYAGLMISPEGQPRVIEFNCRLGDPETQAILPLLATPLHEVLLACVEGRLESFPALEWRSGVCGSIVVAADGYPGTFSKGHEIRGLQAAEREGAIVYQAGTRLDIQRGPNPIHRILSDGGRVLAVSAVAETFDGAFAAAYRAADLIDLEGKYYRRDIGYQVRST